MHARFELLFDGFAAFGNANAPTLGGQELLKSAFPNLEAARQHAAPKNSFHLFVLRFSLATLLFGTNKRIKIALAIIYIRKIDSKLKGIELETGIDGQLENFPH